MRPTRIVLAVILACSLVLAQAAESSPKAKDIPRPKGAKDKAIDPAIAAAAAAAGAAAAVPLSIASQGTLSPGAAASVIANKVVAADSAGKALGSAAGAVGSLLAHNTGKLHQAGMLAGKTLVELVRALTSLNIAGGQLAVAGANTALSGLVGKIREAALNIGNIYTDLLGEFGRSLGAGVNLVSGLAGSGAARALNPISIGVDALNFELNSLISFLQGAVDVTAAGGPAAGAAIAPFIGILRAVQAVLNALGAALLGPAAAGNPIQALNGAVQGVGNVAQGLGIALPGAAAGVAAPLAGAAGSAAGAAGTAAGAAVNGVTSALGLINTAQGLIGKLLKV